MVVTMVPTPEPSSLPAQANLESIFDLILAGGPLMIPIGLCSIVALAYATERWIPHLSPSWKI